MPGVAGTASSASSAAMSNSRCGWSWRRPSTTVHSPRACGGRAERGGGLRSERRPTRTEATSSGDAPWRLEGARGAVGGSHGRLLLAAEAPRLVVPSLTGVESVDSTTVSFLLEVALSLKKRRRRRRGGGSEKEAELRGAHARARPSSVPPNLAHGGSGLATSQ